MRLMRMRDFLMIPAAGLSLLVALPGQAQWQMQGGHMRTKVVVVGENGERTSLPVLPGERVAAPPGASWAPSPRNANGTPAPGHARPGAAPAPPQRRSREAHRAQRPANHGGLVRCL